MEDISKATVIVADDHELVLETIVKMINNSKLFEVVGTASNGMEAVERIRSITPDLAVLDFSMPGINGIEAAQRIRDISSGTRIVIFSMEIYGDTITNLLQSGVSGYVLKEEPFETLLKALDEIMKGNTFFSDVVYEEFTKNEPKTEQTITSFSEEKFLNGLDLLSSIEKELFNHLVNNKTIAEIPELLFIAYETVENLLSNIFEKLGVESVDEIVEMATRKGLLKT